MKIVDVKAFLMKAPVEGDITFAHMKIPERSAIVMRIETDEGIVGYGDMDAEPSGDSSMMRYIRDRVIPLLIGEDPTDMGRIRQKLFAVPNQLGRYQSLEMWVIGTVDLCLWDIVGKMAGLPVHRLLGSCRTTLDVYASLSYEPPERVPQRLDQIQEAGFRAAKVRIGVEPERDREVVKAARLAVGERFRLMADANSSWQRRDCVRRARQLEEFDLYWLEEPLEPFDLPGYQDLTRGTDIPIALGEHEIFTRYDVRELIANGIGNIFQPDVRLGISETVAIAHIASAWEIPVVPHFYGPGLRFAAQLHVAAAIPNGGLVEYSVVMDPLRKDLIDPPLLMTDGTLDVPEAPGLGVTVDESLFDRYGLERV